MARTLVAARGILAILLIAGGCSGPKGDGPLVGVSLPTRSNAFYETIEEGLRGESAGRKLALEIEACNGNASRQARHIQEFVGDRAAAIVIAPCDPATAAQAIANAARAGIPVFTIVTPVPEATVVAHVGSDDVQGGMTAAHALARHVGESGELLIIDHPSAPWAEDRIRGFQEGAAMFSGVSVVGRPAFSGDRGSAMAVVRDAMRNYSNLKGVFAIDDEAAIGAAAAIEVAGRHDIAVVGYGSSLEALAIVKRGGPIKSYVIENPVMIARIVIKRVMDHLTGAPVEPATVVPPELRTPSTLR